MIFQWLMIISRYSIKNDRSRLSVILKVELLEYHVTKLIRSQVFFAVGANFVSLWKHFAMCKKKVGI